MTRWAAFVGLTGVVVSLVVVLATLTQRLLDAESSQQSTVRLQPTGLDPAVTRSRWVRVRPAGRSTPTGGTTSPRDSPPSIPTVALFVNVVLTQGVFGGVLLVGALVFSIPISAFGVGPASLGAVAPALGLGIGLGLWIGSELAVSLADAVGIDYDQGLQAMLTPTTQGEWILLFGVVLPIVAASEEFIFRAAAIGVPATGLDASPWALAVVSSLAFGVAHGAQGRAGVAVTGLLGLALASVYIATGSLLVVIVAHYVVNATEFLVNATGTDPIATTTVTR
ncbi:Metal-dependent membrane protease, CAAX family [Halorhabdus sp. SVX81]|uniref:CPBP family intramembrane glutamic endopeptidase n=1 Tax=Halorhabdus sp. SVX81 TaxID=2978283 RepID=UPI0023D9E4E1|nr:CPBP family intramembrane glutamic endopeptidase [Halorhabdus sp. SVX81]WEL17850.1 Metal-dependent membrane protease, CAAX family [Halorhabdus sp. SVX81]